MDLAFEKFLERTLWKFVSEKETVYFIVGVG